MELTDGTDDSGDYNKYVTPCWLNIFMQHVTIPTNYNRWFILAALLSGYFTEREISWGRRVVISGQQHHGKSTTTAESLTGSYSTMADRKVPHRGWISDRKVQHYGWQEDTAPWLTGRYSTVADRKIQHRGWQEDTAPWLTGRYSTVADRKIQHHGRISDRKLQHYGWISERDLGFLRLGVSALSRIP